MDTFGKRLAECRKTKDFSQKDLAKAFHTSHTTIGKYERNEMTPSIEAAKKLAKILDTTVGYLLGENEQVNLFKDPVMLRRLNDISKFPEKDKNCILYALDAMINNVKLKAIQG